MAKAAKSENPSPYYLRRAEVQERTGLGRSAVFDWVRRGHLPKPIKLTPSGSRVAWLRGDIEAWLEARKAERDAVGAKRG